MFSPFPSCFRAFVKEFYSNSGAVEPPHTWQGALEGSTGNVLGVGIPGKMRGLDEGEGTERKSRRIYGGERLCAEL